MGFDGIRLPVQWSAFCSFDEKTCVCTIDSGMLERVDAVVVLALERHLWVVVNDHHDERLCKNPLSQHTRFLSMWAALSTHYAKWSDHVLFELLNEPFGEMTVDRWNDLLALTVPVIRATNPTRWLVIGSGEYNAAGTIEKLRLPPHDRRIIATFHFYEPFHFTHQGAEWVQRQVEEKWDERWRGTDEDRKKIENRFSTVKQTADKLNVPFLVGEFGVYCKARAKYPEDAAKWTRFVRECSEKHGFSWAYWEYDLGFGIFDRGSGKVKQDIADALFL